MYRIRIIIALFLFIASCNKNDKDISSNASKNIATKLRGEWHLISETRSGSFDNSTYRGLSSDYIEYRADGKAYSRIQGQWDLIYENNLDTVQKTMLFQYVSTHPHFMSTQPCAGSPGCPRVAKIKFISDHLLVLGNSFEETTNGTISSLTITDSLSR